MAYKCYAGTGSILTYGGNNIWLKAAASADVNATVGSGVSLTVDNNDPLSAGDPNIDDENDPQAGTGNHAGLHTRAIVTGEGHGQLQRVPLVPTCHSARAPTPRYWVARYKASCWVWAPSPTVA
ncbi:hypothetical protein ACIPZF_17935 [Pseudomonas sp. NPDC089752]|uniref:hypothetical protein n=1 Tax=Pseudomonas sp. NPDC089752 TaxID=3364472 RepID=UPI0037FA0215